VIVVKMFTFAISSPDEFLSILQRIQINYNILFVFLFIYQTTIFS